MIKIIIYLLTYCLNHPVFAYPEVWEKIRPIKPRHNAVIMELLKININTANKADLQKLSGIGPKKAEAILTYRNQHGAFKKLTDLESIKGFSKKMVSRLQEKNRDIIVFK